MRLTPEEEMVVGVVRVNREEKKVEWKREWRIGRLRIVAHWRHPKSIWGRFGGGWQWKLGNFRW